MGIYEELQARGLIAQVTDEERIRDLVNNGKATFYIGFDPTADSLHVGHFMALCLMKRLQEAGNKPIALIGGGTGYIGDPSGRTDMRSMMTPEQIQHNCDCFKKQIIFSSVIMKKEEANHIAKSAIMQNEPEENKEQQEEEKKEEN